MKRLMMPVLFFVFGLSIMSGCLPPAPPYPERNPALNDQEAQQISDSLEAYIKDWLAGKVPAGLPMNLWPMGMNTDDVNGLYLVNPDTISSASQYMTRDQHLIDFNKLVGFNSDPHCVYNLANLLYAPFGSRCTVEGEFPYCRFMSMQATAPFNKDQYIVGGIFGQAEVAVHDIDIDPLAGHVNPFRPGANRQATNRSYKVNLDFAKGNMANLMTDYRPPQYRRAGNQFYVGGIAYQGPWGADPNYMGFKKRPGHWDHGFLWFRYYRVDAGKALGGVAAPKLSCYLPDGRKFYINADSSGWDKRAKDYLKNVAPANGRSANDFMKKDGWVKQWGIFREVATCHMYYNNMLDANGISYARALDLGVTGRGENQPAPGNWETSASAINHVNYFGKSGDIVADGDKVCVLVGMMPTFPDTRNTGHPRGIQSGSTLKAAQCRYLSFTTYDAHGNLLDANNADNKYYSYSITTLCDDEITVNSQGKYVIVYSTAANKPANATKAAGVTWANQGYRYANVCIMRWMSTYPDHAFSMTPNENFITWAETDLAGSRYNKAIIMNNVHTGKMGWYFPTLSYMTKAKFESFGSPVNPDSITPGEVCGGAINQAAGTNLFAMLPLGIALGLCAMWAGRRRIR